MATDEQPRTDEDQADDDDRRPLVEKPEVTDEHKEKASEMARDYKEERPTVVMPGTGGAVSGTAVNDWIDEDGEPKFAKENAKQNQGAGGENGPDEGAEKSSEST